MKNYKIINASSDLGVSIDGSDKGPLAISSCFKNIDSINIEKPNIIKSKDKDDLSKNLDAVNEFNKELYGEIDKVIKDDYFPICLGGDHSVVIASGLASINNNESLGIIWVDAHTDYNTFETTRTGNLHGLPLAALDGYKCEKLTNFLSNKFYNPKNTVVVGARSIDAWEYPNCKDAGITIFTTEDVHRMGAKEVMKKAIEIASNGTNGIHISYDLDVIDPKVAPGVSVDEENGISENEAYEIMDAIVNNKNLVKSLDLVEYNPSFDKNNATLNIAVNLLNKFIEK